MRKKRSYQHCNSNNKTDHKEDNDQNEIDRLENELNFYKEKLIILARAHATLLTLVGAKPGELFHSRKQEDDNNKKIG
eukprot:14454249-Ditylum_brightwellii.AAC.1